MGRGRARATRRKAKIVRRMLKKGAFDTKKCSFVLKNKGAPRRRQRKKRNILETLAAGVGGGEMKVKEWHTSAVRAEESELMHKC